MKPMDESCRSTAGHALHTLSLSPRILPQKFMYDHVMEKVTHKMTDEIWSR